MGFKKGVLKEIKLFIACYLLGAFLLLGLIYLIIVLNDFGQEDYFDIWLQLLAGAFRFFGTYIILLIPYTVFLLARGLVRNFKKNSFKGLVKGIGLKIITPALSLWIILFAIDHYRENENFNYEWDSTVENVSPRIKNLYANDSKQRGMHVFELSEDSADLEILKTNNIEWLTFVPFISQENYNEPTLRTEYGAEDTVAISQYWKNVKRLSDQYGFKIMIKPHIWLSNRSGGIWRSAIEMKTEADWNTWFDAYDGYILHYAKLSEALNVELFCIGTELHTTVLKKSDRWLSLIKKVRSVYSGKLTYAANWNQEVSDISFWKELDFIGIQAYFPIATTENPTIKELESGWNKHVDFLNQLYLDNGKPILFTEMGYKATPDAGISPWEWNTISNRFYKKISKKTQALCYQAFFNTIWKQPWFKGVHLWKWQATGENDGNNNAFDLENKPALNIIAKGFDKQ